MARGSSAAEEVRAALARLRAAGEALRARPRGEVIAALDDVVAELRDPRSAVRRRLAAELPTATGFHPATLEAGLALGFGAWTRDALAGLIARELASGPPGRHAAGFPTTSVVLGGAIPMPSTLQMLAPLALQSAVLARPGSHDLATPRIVAAALAQRDAGLGAAVEVVAFPHGDRAALAALCEADCVVATGGDGAVAAIQRLVRPWQRFVGFGHRFSIAVLGRAGDLAGTCARLAEDVALWDQLGCLSPIALYAIGWRWEERAPLLTQLESAFAECEKRWPIGRLGDREGAERAQELATLELRAASGSEVELRRAPGGGWAIAGERGPDFRGSPLFRMLRVHFVPNAAALCSAVAPVARHLASAGVGALAPNDAREVARLLADLGASRICAVGEMQAPPLGWCHDGQGVLLPLARLVDGVPD